MPRIRALKPETPQDEKLARVSRDARLTARRECGHADWRKCALCQRYDDPQRVYQIPSNGACRHRECIAAYARLRKHGMSFSYENLRAELLDGKIERRRRRSL